MSIPRCAARLLILVAVFIVAMAAAPRKAAGVDKADGVVARLVKVQEVRRARLVSQKETTYEFTKPGLELTFQVTLPDGKQLIDIEQPKKVVATDSAGHDLTDIEKSFMGTKQYVTFLRRMSEPSKEFTIQLAPPTRSATGFSLATTFAVWGYRQLTDSAVTVSAKPVALDASLFGGTEVTAVLRSRNDRTQLVLTPGSIKEFIEKVSLSDGGREYDNGGAMWNNAMLSYEFDTRTSETMTARFTLRSGMSKMPCSVSLENQPLP